MKSFEELCAENYGRIYKYIFVMTGNRESAEDLVQDVFTAALLKGDAFLCHENPTAFLYKTARNQTLTFLKRLQRTVSEPLDENTSGGDDDLCEELLRDYDRRIDEDAYTGQVISLLDIKQQALYRERYVERKPIREIAVGQDVSETAMRMRLVRLRRDIISAVRDLKLDEKSVT
jgi:RNA polymerase sigma-70 factor (ECF subfamily)